MDIYKQFIKTYGVYIIVMTVVAGTIGLVATRLMPESYDISLSLGINRIGDESDQYYSYDGFYAIQAEEQFSKTVATWFSTPDFVKSILSNAQSEDVEALSVKDLRNQFTAEQVSATTVEVGFGVSQSDQGETMTQAIEQAVVDRLMTQNQDEYQIFVGDPVVRRTEYPAIFWGTGAALIGFVGALGAFALREYLK